MNKLRIITLSLFLLISFNVSAMSIDYYYHPQCSHCNNIEPFMFKTINTYNNINWNILDTSKNSYNIEGTPTLIIHTNDNRQISIFGSKDIPEYLECEINEMSTLQCPTYSYLNCTTNSFFIR